MTYRAELGDRSQFPDLSFRAYAAHAAISPPSRMVRDAIASVLNDYSRVGVGAFKPWLDRRKALKRQIATLVGAGPESVAFVPNTTAGVTAIAMCFPWKRQDRVLLFRGEFPANVTPWQRAAELFDLELAWHSTEAFQRSTAEALERIEFELQRGLRLIAMSAVQFQTGLRMPLREVAALAHRYGAELFVDGIQACGATPIDIGIGIDYLSCGGHKWLMGIEGAGFLYVAPSRIGSLRLHLAGWLSHEDAFRFLFDGPGELRYDRPIRRSADFVEGGAQNVVGYAALEASLSLIQQIGTVRIFEHVNAYFNALEPLLVARGFRSLRAAALESRSTILSLVPPPGRDVAFFQRTLEAHGVAVSIPDGLLRFAPHWPNSLEEVNVIAAALDAEGGV